MVANTRTLLKAKDNSAKVKRKFKHDVIYWTFLLPCLSAVVLSMIIPFLMGLFYTFTNWNGIVGTKLEFVGGENYINALTDPEFLYSFKITLVYALINIFAVNVIGFLLALLVTRKMRFTNLYRTAFYMPNLVGGLILGFVWQFIFNEVVVGIGQGVGIEALSSSFLGQRETAILAILIVSIWQSAGYLMIIYIAGIQSISEDVIEAATIDGANYLQILRGIILPLVVPSITINLFITLSGSFGIYDLNVSLTGGGPGNYTEMITMNIFKEAFNSSMMGVSQAKAIIFFIFIGIVSLTQVYFTKKLEVES